MIFKSANDTLKAWYKGHLLSTTSTATGSNGQQKIMTVSYYGFREYYAVYESGREIWYTSSADGIAWNPESRLSDGTALSYNPSLNCYYLGSDLNIEVVWATRPRVLNAQANAIYSHFYSGIWQPEVVLNVDTFETNTKPVVSHGWLALNMGNPSRLQVFKLGSGVWHECQPGPPGSNAHASNPSILANDTTCCLVFHDSSAGLILYNSISVTNFTTWATVWNNYNNSDTISSGSGHTGNGFPSIAGDNSTHGNIYVAWQGMNSLSGQKEIVVRRRSNNAWEGSFTSFNAGLSCPTLPDFSNPVIRALGSSRMGIVWNSSDNKLWAARYVYENSAWKWKTYLANVSGVGYPTLASQIDSSTLRGFYTSISGPPYPVDSFSVSPSAFIPSGPSLQSPQSGAQVSKSLTVTWNCTFGASSYSLQVATDSNFSYLTTNDSNITATQRSPTLNYSTQYWWHVKAKDFNGTSAWSQRWTFTTQPPAPAVPQLVSPSNGATNVSIGTLVTWSDTSIVNGYELQVSTNSNFTAITTDQSGISGTQWYPSLPYYSTQYWWRVDASNLNGTSAWSSVWSFTTQANSGGGGGCCPYIYVQGDTSLNEENNVLPQSEDPGNKGKDVSDYYKLLKPPTAKNGHYELDLKEFEHERSFLDQLQLIAVDHPSTDSIAVSSDGSIIQYRTPFRLADILSGDTTLMYIFNWMDGITYGAGNGKHFNLKVKENSDAFTTFSNAAHGGVLIGGWVEHGYTGQSVCQPKTQKVGSASSGGGPSVIEGGLQSFTFRERPTLVYVPLKELKDTVAIDVGEKIQIDYLNLAIQVSDNYSTQDLGLVSAVHSRQGSVTSALANADGSYATLVPGESIRLQFSAPPLDPTLTRSFILVSRGHYEHLADASAIEKPKTFLLGQNYPNPFNPTTTMDYQLASPGYVSVVVYNILGEEVARLVQTQQDAGYYSTAWNAVASPSGIYYVRMTVSDQSGKQLYATTKKLVLMK